MVFLRILAVLAIAMVGVNAHEGHGQATFASGFTHPFFVWDHLVAMVVVGMLAQWFEGRKRWALPLLFVSGLAAGGVLARFIPVVYGIEFTIALSVVVFGVCLCFSTMIPLAAVMVLVFAAGIPHGHAHLVEAGEGSLMLSALGMILGSGLLHGAGIARGAALRRLPAQQRVGVAVGSLCAGLGIVMVSLTLL